MARGNQRPRRSPQMGGLGSTTNRVRPNTGGFPAPTPKPTIGGVGAHSDSPYAKLQQGHGIKYDAQGRAQGWTPPPTPPTPPAPTWQDSEYGTGVNDLIRQNTDERTAITGAGQRDEQNLQETIRQMTQARGEDLLGANSASNRQGLLFSSTLGKQRGGIERDYAARQGSAQTAFNDRAAERMTALQRLGTITADPNSPNGFAATGDALAGLGGIIAASRARALERNQGIEAPITPDAGVPPATPPSASGATSPAQKYANKGFKSAYDPKRGGAWHIYPDGRKVFVKGAKY